MTHLRWEQYPLTIVETGEVRSLPATSDAIARDLACQRLAEDHWRVGDYSVQRESYDASEWLHGVVEITRDGVVVATLRKP